MVTTSSEGARASMPPTPRVPAGTVLCDRFLFEAHVGSFAYGDLYRGRDQSDGKAVSLQVLNPALASDARIRQRLDRQVQLAVQLEHKNIAATYGLFTGALGSESVLFLAAELLDGQSLREMIDKKRAAGKNFTGKGAYNIVAHLCNALTYAHGATLHGGLTPDSIWVNSAGRVKVLYFAYANVLAPPPSTVPNTLAVVAPELSTGQADLRADVYSLGVVLYQLLTGTLPPASWVAPSQAVSGLNPGVDDVAARCLQPTPETRFATPAEVKEALFAALGDEVDGFAGGSIAPGAMPTPAQATAAAAVAPPAAAKAAAPPKAPPAAAKPPPVAPNLSPARGMPAVPKAAPARPAPSVPNTSPARGAPAAFQIDASLSSVDEETERWLIQKDKLDFGPFNLRDVRAQVEAGKILGDHTLIDTETGERRRVKDHPALRQIAATAESKHADKQREDAELADRRKQRGRVVTLLVVIALVVLGVGGGVTWYVLTRKPVVVKEVVRAPSDEYDFMKGVQIVMKVDPPPPKKPVVKHRKGGKGSYSDVTNLGDASEGGGDETLDQSVVQGVMSRNFKVLVGCIGEERKRNPGLKGVDMDFTIKGTGQVDGVKVNGATAGGFHDCMYGKMQAVTFPKFNGSKTHANFSLQLK